MKIEENLELFNKLKEEFKKKYGTKEIELHPHIQLARRDHDSGGEPYMTKLRINPNNGEEVSSVTFEDIVVSHCFGGIYGIDKVDEKRFVSVGEEQKRR